MRKKMRVCRRNVCEEKSAIFLSLFPLLEITTRAFSWQIITH